MPSSVPHDYHQGQPSSGEHGADHHKAFVSLGLSLDTWVHFNWGQTENKQSWQLSLLALMG